MTDAPLTLGTCLGLAAGITQWLALRTGHYRNQNDHTRLNLKHVWIVIPLSTIAGTIAASLHNWLALAAGLYLTVGAALVWIDLDVHRIPDAILKWTAPMIGAALVLAAAMTGEWATLGGAALGAGIFTIGFLALAIFGSMGLGDVKLAAITGALVGAIGWQTAALSVFACFLLTALAAVLLLLRGRSKTTHLAFGPGIIAGVAVAVLAGV